MITCVFRFLIASLFSADGDPRAVVGMDARLLTDPPALKRTAVRAPYGAIVEVAEEKTVGEKAFARIKMKGDRKPLGWIAVKGNLGHVREFEPSMKPDDQIKVDGLEGLDLVMASIYNVRGRYLKEQADTLGADPADLAAVLHVESRGRGFDDDGNLVTRFENHIFFSRWGAKNKAKYDQHFKFNEWPKHTGHAFRKNANEPFESFHLNNAKEIEILAFARKLDDAAALASASYGAPQVMGFNHKTLGYANVQSMHQSFHSGIKPQLDGMIAFIKSTKLCMDGLKNKDYFLFASGYNGKGKEHDYGPKIQAASVSYAKVAKGKEFAR